MQFLPAHIPTGIDTYEKLALWVGVVLEQACGTRECIEIEGARPEKIAQAPMFTDANNNLRASVRLSVPIDRAVYSDRTKKYWCFAETMVDTTVPVSFTTA